MALSTAPPPSTDTAWCPGCETDLAVSEFYRDRGRSTGRKAHCKSCTRERVGTGAGREWRRAYYQQPKWKARARARYAERMATQPEYREARRLDTARRRASWTPERRAAEKAAKAAWQRANRELVNAATRRRAAARAGVQSLPVTLEQWAAKVAYWGGLCWVCRKAPWSQIDHVKPISKKGPHMLANLRPICGPCNVRKGSRWPTVTSGT